MKKERERQIDILRGIAVFTMISANMAPSLLKAPHPFFIRVYGSFAAPLFILLSGMMVARVMSVRREVFSYYVKRGLILMAVASLMDMGLYGVMPMICVDVLCLIGLSLMVIYPLMRLRWQWRFLIGVLIFALTPVLHHFFGYPQAYFYAMLKDGVAPLAGQAPSILRNWLLQAAFPVFPWMGFAIMGSVLGVIRWGPPVDAEPDAASSPQKLQTFNSLTAGVGALSLLITGAAVFWAAPGLLMIRFDYSELFYPPTMGFFLTAFGVIGCLFYIVDRHPGFIPFQWLRPLGEASLFVYVTHYVIITFILVPCFGLQSLGVFELLYAGLVIVLFLLCLLLRRLRPAIAKLPMPLRIVFGA